MSEDRSEVADVFEAGIGDELRAQAAKGVPAAARDMRLGVEASGAMLSRAADLAPAAGLPGAVMRMRNAAISALAEVWLECGRLQPEDVLDGPDAKMLAELRERRVKRGPDAGAQDPSAKAAADAILARWHDRIALASLARWPAEFAATLKDVAKGRPEVQEAIAPVIKATPDREEIQDDVRSEARRMVREAIARMQHENATLDRIGKFARGAVTTQDGRISDRALSFLRRAAAVGVAAGFTLALVPHDAHAFDAQQAINVLGGLAGAATGVLPRNDYGYTGNGWNRPAYSPGWGQPRPPAGAYYPDAYRGGYVGMRPAVPSEQFILVSKAMVAVRSGSVLDADRDVDAAMRNGLACVQRLGPAPQCVVRIGGVSMDFGRARFVATWNGMPAASETGGYYQEQRPDIVRAVFADAIRIKREEDYARRDAPAW